MITFKQLTAWATALKTKLKHDIGFSTQFKIAGYLVMFAGIVFGSFLVSQQLQNERLAEYLSSPLPIGPSIYSDFSGIIITLFFLVVVLMSALGTYFAITALTVKPLQNIFALKKRFVSGIAHELRTPLSVLRINNEISRFRAETNSDLARLCEENMADIDKIDDMLSTILLFDRMLGAQTLQFEPVDLVKTLKTVAERLKEIAANKKVTVVFSVAKIPPVCANQSALEQAFFNVLINAITYTPHGGEVIISSTGIEHGYVLITMTDNGPGIPAADIPHLFEPFYRSERVGKLSGTGIGLATVEEIMRLHKGTIKVSEDAGKGAAFTFCLPTSLSSL